MILGNERQYLRELAVAQDVFGDILQVRLVNNVNCWGSGLTEKVVNLMGMENMFCSMKTEEDEFHTLMSMLVKGMIRFLRWLEDNNLLKDFDEDAFRNYIRNTAQLTKDCKTEYIFRDIYKLHGNLEKLKKAVQIVREETM